MTFIHRASRSHRRRLGGTYNDLVLGTGPIAYWPQSETSGTAANCLVNPAQNGTYTGVALASDNTGPFGTPAPFYDGANDYLDVLSAALQAAWDAGGAEWSIMTWWKVANAGVWTDGLDRKIYNLYMDADNNVTSGRTAANGTMQHRWEASTVVHTRVSSGLSLTGWNCSLATRSEGADELRWYRNGAWLETDTVIGNWASAAPWSKFVIGATSIVPAQPWHGWLGPVAFWPRALPLAEVENLYPG